MSLAPSKSMSKWSKLFLLEMIKQVIHQNYAGLYGSNLIVFYVYPLSRKIWEKLEHPSHSVADEVELARDVKFILLSETRLFQKMGHGYVYVPFRGF